MSSVKIAITGPESTGKSTISNYISQKYSGVLIEEYAREYLENIDRPYNEKDLDIIAKKQFENIESALYLNPKLLVADTEMTVMKIWSAHKYGCVSHLITQLLQNQEFDLYLLMDIDVKWQYDKLREHPQPELRKYFMDWYIKEMILMKRNFHIISGNEAERQNNTDKIISQFIK
jgi:nicotinamide riboside kinase